VSLGRGDNQFCHKRVYCHEALHLKEKLQSAGSKQETVGWDTDEASDASTTEADLAVYSVPPPRHVFTVWRTEVNTRIHVHIQLQSKYVEYELRL